MFSHISNKSCWLVLLDILVVLLDIQCVFFKQSQAKGKMPSQKPFVEQIPWDLGNVLGIAAQI